MPQVREFEIPRQLSRWKRCLKVYSRSFILYRDYSNSLTLSNVGELSWGWSRVVTPTARKCSKKNHKNRAMHGQIQGLLAFYQSYSQHLVRWYPLWNPLPRKLYFAYLAVFFTWVSCLAPEFGAYDRKMSLQNFQGWPKKDKMGISCDSVSSIH